MENIKEFYFIYNILFSCLIPHSYSLATLAMMSLHWHGDT